MLLRAVHIPSTVGIPPKAMQRVRDVADVRTLLKQWCNWALIADSRAPVLINSGMILPSTMTPIKFCLVGKVSRGFQIVSAASPVGAAAVRLHVVAK